MPTNRNKKIARSEKDADKVGDGHGLAPGLGLGVVDDQLSVAAEALAQVPDVLIRRRSERLIDVNEKAVGVFQFKILPEAKILKSY